MGVVDPTKSDIKLQRKSPEKYVERPQEADDEYARKKFKDVLSGKDGKQAKKNPLELDEGLPSAMSLVANASKKKAMKDAEQEAGEGSEDNEMTSVQSAQLAHDVDVEVEKTASSSSEDQIEKIDNLREIYKMLVAGVVELKTSGRTDTTLTLHYPPLFNGAKITVTEFSSAKGEYNITLSELNPQAKNLVDLPANRDLLLQSLQDKGYMVHIMIATTEKESVVVGQEEAANPNRNREREGQQQGRQQQQEEEQG